MKVQGKKQCNSEAGRGNTAYATDCKPRRQEGRGDKQAKMAVEMMTNYTGPKQVEELS